MRYDESKSLTRPDRLKTTEDGKEVITLEDFLNKHLKQPEVGGVNFAENVTSILKWLGVADVGMAEAKRATRWLRANGFRAVHGGKVFKFALRYPQSSQYHVV